MAYVMAASVQSLPESALLRVFSFLSPAELRDCVSRVCAQWRELHGHPSLYRALHLTQAHRAADVLRWVGFARRLRSLSISRVDCNTILASLRNCDHLLSLNLRESTAPKRYAINLKSSTFLNVLRISPALRTLKLQGIHVSELILDKGVSRVLSNLRVLHCVRLTCSSKWDVLDLVLSCPRLEELKVNGCRCDTTRDRLVSLAEDALVEMCARLSTTLRVLHLDCGPWTEQGLSSLTRCSRLRDLCIQQAQGLSPGCLLVLGSVPGLRKLEVSQCEGLGEDVWVRLVTGPRLRLLESLVLVECGFTNRVAEAIGESLRNLVSLSLLRQGRCPLTPHNQRVCASGLESILRGCSKLETLKLCWVAIECHDSILMIPKLLPGLKVISISPTPKSVCRALLGEYMPHLVIDRFQEDAAAIFGNPLVYNSDALGSRVTTPSNTVLPDTPPAQLGRRTLIAT